jgi:hypothetical protein
MAGMKAQRFVNFSKNEMVISSMGKGLAQNWLLPLFTSFFGEP